jgi:hypothetical protein
MLVLWNKPTHPDREHIRKLHATFDRDVGEVETLILEVSVREASCIRK